MTTHTSNRSNTISRGNPAEMENSMASKTTVAKGYVDVNSKSYRKSVLERLAEAAGETFSADQGVAYHVEPPNKISLPQGMSTATGAKRLAEQAAADAQYEVFSRTFRFRPWDGAYAMVSVMKKAFGTTGRAIPIHTFFGSTPPQQIEIEIDIDQTVQIPWGRIEFSIFDGTITTGYEQDSDYGMLFRLQIEAPKHFGSAIKGFFNLIEVELEENSIYKGKAVEAVLDRQGVDGMRFLRLVEDGTIVYNDDVMSALDTVLWGVIRNAELVKADGRKINNRILVYGPYGTGKSESGKKTASVCREHGWTFFMFKSGESGLDELEKVVKTARLYQPAVVMIEDVDVYASNPDPNYMSRLSNLFDGIQSKGDEVMLLMTSNKPAEFSKSMLRAGRIDRMIEIGTLDRDATEEMIRRVIGEHRLSKDLDFDRVWAAMDDFEPSFVRQVFDQAATAALVRSGTRDYVLDTEDFVVAADILRPQHDMHRNKEEHAALPSVETLLASAMIRTLRERAVLEIDLNGGDYEGTGSFEIKEIASV